MPARTKRTEEKIPTYPEQTWGEIIKDPNWYAQESMDKRAKELIKAELSSHYREGFADKIEVLDILKDKLTPEQFEGFCLGSMFKYILRANFKEDANKDLAKAVDYGTILQEFRKGRRG